MGCFDIFCSFCAGPLCDARSAWLRYIEPDAGAPWPPKDGEWGNPPGYPVPSKPVEEIVCITPEDGSFWNDWVCVGPKWNGDWVSPPCEEGSYGDIFIDGSDDWQRHSPGRYLRIHRGCLSFLCRRVGITPKLLWESLYQPGSDYLRYGEDDIGLLYCLKYYDMDGRNGQSFGYAVERQTPREDGSNCVDRWDDPDSMDDTAWILSRPTCLTPPAVIGASPPPAAGELSSYAECMRIFGVSELLDLVLSVIVKITPHDVAIELKESAANFDAPSLITATQSLLALCQVNRFFHAAITRHRQGLFLLLASQYGWMLPSTPADLKEWRDRSGPELDLRLDQSLDWRGYLLTFLRKQDRVVKNRWRFHRMAVQCARGRARPATEENPAWRWSVGELGLRSSIVPPEALDWELPPLEG
ncbi:hypothetical protein DFH08DRAFT_780644 [Mycena albidolilacea]|uniref:Uncharacterized protein n=1 Tax=Mycena albidolilacea TaxID=1033008 RepID=A0AAD7ER00_9AGAR|nr:hypothetical protein DFH08DRAFT_780644 [Mycena albidolilacea]